MRFSLLLSLLTVSFVAVAQGPPTDPPRVDDHMWRRRIVMSIDLKEKINRPLITEENEDGTSYTYSEGDEGPSAPQFKKGLIYALLHEYREGNIIGYRTDSLDAPYLYKDFEVKYKLNYDANAGQDVFSEGADEEEFDFDDFGGGFDEFEDDFGDFDDLGEEIASAEADIAAATDAASQEDYQDFKEMVSRFSTRVIFIEDRIFDKVKSDMYYDVKYIQLIFSDPQFLEEAYVTFHYDETTEALLDKINWKNPHNDADYRTLKEIVELRRFNSIDNLISGRTALTLAESRKRRDQMLEFEHALWEY